MSIGMIRDPFSSTSSNWRVSVRLWDVRVMNKRGTALAGWQVCVCVGWMDVARPFARSGQSCVSHMRHTIVQPVWSHIPYGWNISSH